MGEFSNIPGCTVLVVDDEPANRRLLRALLEKEGHRVEECANGADCVTRCMKEPPGLVLLDVMLPDVDGLSICQRLRCDFNKDELPIVLVTSLIEGSDIKAGLESGANDYITKPIDRSILLARVRNQLSISEATRELIEQKRIVLRNLEVQSAIGNALDQAILVHTASGEIIYGNQKLSAALQGASALHTSIVFNQIFDGSLADQHRLYLQAIERNPEIEIIEEVEIEATQSRHYQIESRVIRFDDEVALRLWVWRDVSHTRELERRVQQQLKLETVSLFAVGVAHNFNNYMGSMLGACDILDKTIGENKTAVRCLNVIKKALDYSQQLTRKMSLLVRREQTDSEQPGQSLREAILNIVAEQQAVSSKQIEFDLSKVAKDAPLVAMEQSNLNNILANIISNAVDALKSTGRIVFALESQGEHLLLKVSDDGCGMDQITLQRAFEPFFSTKNLDTRNGMSMVGNGLGLWNVYNLLKVYDGNIQISSKPGQGTEVQLLLPIKSASKSKDQADSLTALS